MSCVQSSRLVSVGKAAALANVHVDTIREYMSRGEIEGVLTPGGHRRVSLESVATCFGVACLTSRTNQLRTTTGRTP